MAKVLIIDDNPETLSILSELVTSLQHEAKTAGSGEDGLKAAQAQTPDLILLDVEMGGMSGYEVCRKIKGDAALKHVPVIILTARADVESRIEGLEAGADDYLGKPFSRAELSARVGLCLRRPTLVGGPEKIVEIGNLKLDPKSLQVSVEGKELHLTSREYEILHFFLRHPDRVYDRKALLKEIWPETVVGARTVDTHITHLRKKLQGFTHSIDTMHGQGFILRTKPASGA